MPPTRGRRELAASSSHPRRWRLTLSVAGAAALSVPLVSTAAQNAPSAPPAVARLFSLVRPAFSGDRALATVAFLEQRWRWPGNRPFNESIDHVAEQLRAAGYVEERSATASDRLTYRIESRAMSGPTHRSPSPAWRSRSSGSPRTGT
jgi:hypothetical protein